MLAVAVAVHLATILYAAQHGLTAGAILGRTRGNLLVPAFYALFVLAASVHAPIGLRTVLREWAGWRGAASMWRLIAFACCVAILGWRAGLWPLCGMSGAVVMRLHRRPGLAASVVHRVSGIALASSCRCISRPSAPRSPVRRRSIASWR